MATKIYDTKAVSTVDGTEITIVPLKIAYLRDFMDKFSEVQKAATNTDMVSHLVECAAIAMKQYMPSIKTPEDVEDSFDLPTIYEIVDVAAGISVKESPESQQPSQEKGSSWESLDLAKLEAEVFLLGIWKDYRELELSLSMPELISTLEVKRENDYNDKKFLAAMQGIDLDEQSGKRDAWEEMKARVFSGGKAAGANDIVALQGVNAQKAGFGIGMGLDYVDLTKK
jgi:hypothetical protein